MMPSTPLNKNAFALSIVLWIVAAILFATAMLATLAKDTHSLTKGIDSKLKAQLRAESILEILKFHILTSDFDNNSFKIIHIKNTQEQFPPQIIADGRWYSIGDKIQFRIQDTANMINVMKTRAKSVASLITKDQERELRYTIEDSLKDWRDKDNVVSLNGAESSYYALEKLVKYPIRNSKAIQSVDELRLIKGFDTMSTKRWNAIKQKMYYGNGNVANLTIVDAKYLSYLLKINKSQADALIQLRKKNLNKFIALAYSSKYFNDSYMGFSLSKQLQIEIKVTVENAVSIIKTLIDFRMKKEHLYTTIEYLQE